MEFSHDRRAYDEALAFLYGRINYERIPAAKLPAGSFRLERMKELLDRLGNPQDRLKIVHVAGTKGKGSTATTIAAALIASGYRTGLYTSPHLHRLEERITVDAGICLPQELVELVGIIREAVEAMDQQRGHSADGRAGATFFEITTAMALLHFARRQVDAAVVEVGLGGRFDSTNVCRPRISVITSISFDHTQLLGRTLAAIAGEKAGIIKPGVPVVSGVVKAEPSQTIQHIAQQRGCRLLMRGRDFDFQYQGPTIAENRFCTLPRLATMNYHEHFAGVKRHFEDIELGLLGRHQAANAAVALAVLGQLNGMDFNLPEDSVRTALRNVRCPARIEVVSQRPAVVIDSAHNVASIDALLQVLDESFRARKRILIFATSKEKDAAGMLQRLLPRFDLAILTGFQNNPRGNDAQKLLDLAQQILATDNGRPNRCTVSVNPDAASAWSQANAETTSEDLLCVTGSFFLAAEIRPLAKGIFQPSTENGLPVAP